MGALAFFLSAAVITVFSFTVSEFLQQRRRALRREFAESRGLQTDGDFAVSTNRSLRISQTRNWARLTTALLTSKK